MKNDEKNYWSLGFIIFRTLNSILWNLLYYNQSLQINYKKKYLHNSFLKKVLVKICLWFFFNIRKECFLH